MERISLLTPSFLIHLLENSPNNLSLTRARLAKKIKITKKDFGVMASKKKVVTISLLQLILIVSRKKRRTSLILNTSTAKKRSLFQ